MIFHDQSEIFPHPRIFATPKYQLLTFKTTTEMHVVNIMNFLPGELSETVGIYNVIKGVGLSTS